jgi:hypothetical protein
MLQFILHICPIQTCSCLSVCSLCWIHKTQKTATGLESKAEHSGPTFWRSISLAFHGTSLNQKMAFTAQMQKGDVLCTPDRYRDGLSAGWTEFDFRQEPDVFLYSTVSGPGIRPIKPTTQWAPEPTY